MTGVGDPRPLGPLHHHGGDDGGRDGVVGAAVALAVDESRGSPRAVGGEEPPCVPHADAQDLSGLREPAPSLRAWD